jgi:hypothetical protein
MRSFDMTDSCPDERATVTTGPACGNGPFAVPDSPLGGGDGDPTMMTVLAGNDDDVVDVPTRMPDGVWAWLVAAVDLDPNDGPTLLQGRWVTEQPSASPLYDGDLVVRLAAPRFGAEDVVAVEMLLCYADRWTRVGHWPILGSDWPRVVAPTAAAVMGLWCDVAEAAHLTDPPRLTAAESA